MQNLTDVNQNSIQEAMRVLVQEKIPLWREDISLFAEECFGIKFDDCQKKVLKDIMKQSCRVSTTSGRGIGKTMMEAIIMMWYLVCFPQANIIATAPSQRQLKTILWKEIKKWYDKSIIMKMLVQFNMTKIAVKGATETWFAIQKTASSIEALSGYHAENMLFIIDEASGMLDELWDVITGTSTGEDNRIIAMSQWTKNIGEHNDIMMGKVAGWDTHIIDSRDSAHTNKKMIQDLVDRYGEDSDYIRVNVRGLNPKSEADGIITIEQFEQALPKGAKDRMGVVLSKVEKISVGIDVATKGDDKAVAVAKITDGVRTKYQLLGEWKKTNPTALSGEIIRITRDLIKQYSAIYDNENNFNFKYVELKVDETGVGEGVVSNLAEVITNDPELMTYSNVCGYNNHNDAYNKKYYKNAGAEMYDQLAKELDKNISSIMQGNGQCVELMPMGDLQEELINRKRDISSDGRMAIESKDKFKNRVGKSPDYADAVALANYENPLRIKFIAGRRI